MTRRIAVINKQAYCLVPLSNAETEVLARANKIDSAVFLKKYNGWYYDIDHNGAIRDCHALAHRSAGQLSGLSFYPGPTIDALCDISIPLPRQRDPEPPQGRRRKKWSAESKKAMSERKRKYWADKKAKRKEVPA